MAIGDVLYLGSIQDDLDTEIERNMIETSQLVSRLKVGVCKQMNLEGLTTEARNEATKKIDQVSTLEMVTLINQEDQKVAQAIEKVLPQIAATIDAAAERFKKVDLIYCGAGTSGRLGALDAIELTPTYSVSPERAFGILAGGEKAMYQAIEGAEDSKRISYRRFNATSIDRPRCRNCDCC